MQYRPVRKEEYPAVQNCLTIAFNYQISPEDREQWKAEDFTGHKMWRGAFLEDGTLISLVGLNEMEMYFDGRLYPMGGIGGVCTLPPYRRNGDIRRLFHLICEEMKDKGIPFSYLYPFSHPYYRQYGYELVANQQRVEAPSADLKAYRGMGTARQYMPGDDLTSFMEIEKAYLPRMNGMVHRSEEALAKVLGKESAYSGDRAFLILDDDGVPAAFIAYKVEKDTMEIKEMEWRSDAAIPYLMSFLSNYEGNLKIIRFRCPPELNPLIWWPEPYNLTITAEQRGMLRILLAEPVLRGMRKPEGKGEICLSLLDEFCPWNIGTYLISWDNGMSDVSRTDRPADLTCDIRALNQLTFGTYSWEQLRRRPDIAVHRETPLLAALFPQKSVQIQVFF
ncbi:MAG: GNAT family N-acetyltransferase [Christensenellales bacterium]|jgi:predicted acetyltransferase